jgi:hypothetical protein
MSEPENENLDPLAAAHHLGITPEVLFGYTRLRFRGPGRSRRRLGMVDVNGKTRFSRVELDAFDQHLWGTWANEADPRPDPPKAVVDHLRGEAGNQCLRCGSGIGVQTTHITAWAETRCHHPHNLIRLCSACHVEHDEHNSLILRLPEQGAVLMQRGAEIALRDRKTKRAATMIVQMVLSPIGVMIRV